MKVNNTSVVKANSAEDAITIAVKEQYNKTAADKCIANLVVDGLLGTCIVTEDLDTCRYTETNFFVVTELTHGLLRVEFCTVSEVSDK